MVERRAALVVLALLAVPRIARADAGVPMIAFFLPPAWFALVPIVVLEAGIGVWRWNVPLRSAIVAQAVANCLSTIVGLPLTWVALVLLQGLLPRPDLSPRAQRIIEATVWSAWLPPDETNLRWMVPLAVAVLTVPFFAMSVLVESRVLRRVCRGLSPQRCRSWAIVGNVASYASLLALLSTAFVWPALFERMALSLRPAWVAVIGLAELGGRASAVVRGAM